MRISKHCPECHQKVSLEAFATVFLKGKGFCNYCSVPLTIDRVSFRYNLTLVIFLLTIIVIVSFPLSLDLLCVVLVNCAALFLLLSKLEIKKGEKETKSSVKKKSIKNSFLEVLYFSLPWLIATGLFEIKVIDKDSMLIIGVIGVGVFVVIYSRLKK